MRHFEEVGAVVTHVDDVHDAVILRLTVFPELREKSMP